MKLLILAMGAALLGGCATDRYQKQSTAELCMGFLTAPSANIWQSARAAELGRRDVNCSQYAAAAAVKNQADANFIEGIGTAAVILQQAQPAPPPRPQVCRWVGPNWVCT